MRIAIERIEPLELLIIPETAYERELLTDSKNSLITIKKKNYINQDMMIIGFGI